ncbi:STAS domain-containing protein [Litorivicinus lipolyticus]|uniref:STAS domain-containing protein n=1 Tax=Litorivicinus lipolyticus TaxID=418701 RepID=A0A5Q2Q762_9GAMM|nr:STAS domain-containing protein [Litorivicinus lipolyticus]QGG80239.1 STAS domain-containing protein [Litorivicinus lipolyticus]
MAAVETIKLEKQLQIMLVESLHEELEELINGGAELEIDGSQVERCDTAALQLLVAVQASLTGRDSEIRWTGVSEPLLDAARRLGLTNALNLSEIRAEAHEDN